MVLVNGCDDNFVSKNSLPYIVITFDDQDESIYDIAFPLLAQYGYPATSFINSEIIGREHKLTWEEVEFLELSQGWETGGHTLHHVNLPHLDDEQAEFEVSQDQQNLITHGLKAKSFALPSGHATEAQLQMISKYYQNIRTSQDIHHVQPVNAYHLGYFACLSEYNSDHLIGRIFRGVENNEMFIVIGFHKVVQSPTDYTHNCLKADFSELLDYLYQNQFEVITLDKAVEKCRNLNDN